MRMKNLLIIIILFFFQLQISAEEKDIASYYFFKARTLYEKGLSTEAERLLQASLDFNPGFSESLFLLSRIYLSEQATTRKGITVLEKALKENSWISTNPVAAQKELVRVYLRTKQYREALGIIEKVRARNIYDASLGIMYAQAFSGINNIHAADNVYKALLELYPEYPEVYVNYIRFLLDNKKNQTALAVSERGSRSFRNNTDFIFYRAYLEKNRSRKASLIEDYIEKGGKNPFISLMAIQNNAGKPERFIDFFIEQKGALYVDLIEQFAILLKKNAGLYAYFKKKIGSIEGNRIIDHDKNGFYEEEYIFKENRMIRWNLDDNQDGLYEMTILFHNGFPVEIEKISDPAVKTRYTYSIYPRLSSVCFRKSDTTICYDVIPETLFLSILKKNNSVEDFDLRISLKRAVNFFDEKDTKKHAYAASESEKGRERMIKKWDLHNGKKLVLKEDTDNDGRFDHFIVYDSQESPVKGMQDLDGDGIHEIIEYFENGEMKKISYDENNDGIFDFTQSLGAAQKKEWDLNNDGIADIIERKNASGIIFREYSGIFSERGKK